MEIPKGDVCGRCPFFKDSFEDVSATCGMFEDKRMEQDKYYFGEDLIYGHEMGGYARADRCFAAYLNGATITITPKEEPA